MALELPARVRTQLAEWRSRAVEDRDDVRLVAPASLHVTLAFLGSRPLEEVDSIGVAVSGAVAGLGPVRLRVAGVKPVPARRPRLFALDLSDLDGRAAELQAAVAGALAAGGFHSPERRPFWPHVTFARVRRGAGRVEAIALAPPTTTFTARHVTLYRSWLSPRGSRYEALMRTVPAGS